MRKGWKHILAVTLAASMVMGMPAWAAEEVYDPFAEAGASVDSEDVAYLYEVAGEVENVDDLYEASEASGKAGANVYWALGSDGVLTISGQGDMDQDTFKASFGNGRYAETIYKVVIQSGVTSICEGAFAGLSELQNISLPTSLTSLGALAFSNCGKLISVEIPKGVVVIGDQTFNGCSNLSKVSIPEGVTEIGYMAFQGTKIQNLVLPESLITIGKSAFRANGSLTQVVVPKNVKVIRQDAFEYCARLKSVLLPNGIQTIEQGAFRSVEKTDLTVISDSEVARNYNWALDNRVVTINGREEKSFTLGRDNNSFIHSTDSNGGFYHFDSYEMSDDVFNRLLSVCTKSEKNGLKKNRYKNWSGACYGIAMTMALCFNGQLPLSSVSDNVEGNGYFGFRAPNENQKLRDAIHYYHMSEDLPSVGQESITETWTMRFSFHQLGNVVKQADTLEHFLKTMVNSNYQQRVKVLSFIVYRAGWWDVERHNILVTGTSYDINNNQYLVELYDENTVGSKNPKGSFITMTIPDDFSDFSFSYGKNGMYTANKKTLIEMRLMDTAKVGELLYQADDQSNHSFITVSMKTPFTIRNDNNQTLSYGPQGFGGTMTVYDMQFGGDENNPFCKMEVDTGSNYYVSGMTDSEIDLTIYNSTSFQALEGQGISGAEFHLGKQLKIQGSDYSFKAYTSTDHMVSENEQDLVSVSGTATSDANVIQDGSKVKFETAAPASGLEVVAYRGVEAQTLLKEDSSKAIEVDTASTGFVDVKKGSYYEKPVEWAVTAGITSGTSATTFSPNAPCTRGQCVTFLYRAAKASAEVTDTFGDVNSGKFYAKPVSWAVQQGVTNGTGPNTFSPDATCTRGQIVTFLYKALKGADEGEASAFADVMPGKYYSKPVTWAVNHGITNGTTPTTFGPGEPCTRAQIVTFLYKAYNPGT